MLDQEYGDLREYARSGCDEAFARIVRRYAGPVHAMCARQLGDRQLAEDATQAVFLILSRRARRIGPRTVLSGWLFQTARYVCGNARRARRRREHHEREAAMRRRADDDPTSGPDLAPMLDDALASLRPRDRDAILLRYARDLSAPDVALELNLSDDAARKVLSRAIGRLRAYFARRGAAGVEAGAIAAVLGPTSWTASSEALALGIIGTCAAPAAPAGAAAIAKGAIAAINAHLIKTAIATTAGVALSTSAVVVVVMALVASHGSATASTPPQTVPLANASSVDNAAQSEPTIEEAQRLAGAGDWSAAIDAYGQYLRTLTVEQYRDKKDFDWILDAFERRQQPEDAAGYASLRTVAERKLQERPADDADVWRLQRLLAEIYRRSGNPAAQREHLELAIASYPPHVEGDPSRHSSLQHLYNAVAMLIAENDIDGAETYLLERFAEDGRFVYVFVLPWQQMYQSKRQPQRYAAFVDRVLEAYERKLDADPEMRDLLAEYAQSIRDLRNR